MSTSRAPVLLATIGAALLSASVAAADTIRIGVSVAATGPAASLGIPQRNTVALLPRQIAGQTMEYFVLDDGTDATRGVANMRKLIDEDKVDAVIGSSATPASAAMSTVAAEKGVPLVALAASASLILPMTPEKRWVFKAPQNDSLMADAIAADMAKRGVKTLAFIGFNDGYGDGWLAETERAATAQNIRVVDVERYARPDTSVTGQVLKIIAAKTRRGADRRRRHPGRAAAEDAARARLQGAGTTRLTAPPTPTSCASAAKMSKARSCRSGRSWLRRSCPTPTRSGRSRWTT